MSEDKSADNKASAEPQELSAEKLEGVQGGISLDNGLKMKSDATRKGITLDNGIKMKSGLSPDAPVRKK